MKDSVSYAWIGRPSIVKGDIILNRHNFPFLRMLFACSVPQRVKELPLPVFEVDADMEDLEEESAISRARNRNITKKGWLYKGPDNGNDSSFISFTRVRHHLHVVV